jgi:hypothetical protein
MYLTNCIGNIFSSVNNTILSLISKCTYFVNNTIITKCLLDKEYLYHRYCNITKKACYCIQKNIVYNDTIDNLRYYFLILLISLVLIFFYCTCKKIYRNRHMLDNTNHNTNQNTNYYVIEKNDTLPKYNDIDKEEKNSNQITIVELPPPKYIDID